MLDIGVQSPKPEAGGCGTAVPGTVWQEGGNRQDSLWQLTAGGEEAATGQGAHHGGTLSRAPSSGQSSRSFSGSSLSFGPLCTLTPHPTLGVNGVTHRLEPYFGPSQTSPPPGEGPTSCRAWGASPRHQGFFSRGQSEQEGVSQGSRRPGCLTSQREGRVWSSHAAHPAPSSQSVRTGSQHCLQGLWPTCRPDVRMQARVFFQVMESSLEWIKIIFSYYF